MSFKDIFPELFPVISNHLPLAHRPTTLLSLALTCHQIYGIIVPNLLYHDVRLAGEQSGSALAALDAKAQTLATGKRGTSPSHCIRHLCINSVSTLGAPNSVPDILQNLIDADGLPNLSSLTLHISSVVQPWQLQLENDFILASQFFPSQFWQSLKSKCPNLKNINMTGIFQTVGDKWIERELLSFKRLASIRLAGTLHDYQEAEINFLELPPSLHTLELDFSDCNRQQYIDASGHKGLLNCIIPNLRTLILNRFAISDPTTTTERFWRAHPGIERLELDDFGGRWFDGFGSGMLPNLKYLKCDVMPALALIPHVSASLVSLCLMETYNAQGAYILRKLTPEGKLPALRSLGIQLMWGNSQEPRPGHRWREDENGVTTEADAKEPLRRFDGNYIMSIAKAAPNLEELELMGASDDALVPIVASLSRLPKLHRLTLSGSIDPFFHRPTGKNAPENFEAAALDLANGCRTLDTVTMGNTIGEFLIKDGLSARIVRDRPGGEVKELRRICAWGNIIGREEEW